MGLIPQKQVRDRSWHPSGFGPSSVDHEVRLIANQNVTIAYCCRFVGLLEPPQPIRGLLFADAEHGDIYRYMSSHKETIDDSLRLKWCKQAAEGIAYCHERGVLHCDLRPENMLLDG